MIFSQDARRFRAVDFRTSAGRFGIVAAISVCVLAAAAPAAPLDGGLGLPIDCRPGQTCWIVNYPDMAAGAARRDFACGQLTRDGHNGTDFAVRDLSVMRRGVAVIAAAGGRVVRTRDGAADGAMPEAGGRECGNGVLISHGDGWETQYCHLRRGSVMVRPGQTVRRGDRLGLVGMSGRAEFPHVHLALRQDGRAVDPFTGRDLDSGCGKSGASLWRGHRRPEYDPLQIYAAGFATGRVGLEAIAADASSPRAVPAAAPALVLWVAMLGVRPGDTLRLAIAGPGGELLYRDRRKIARAQVRRLEFGGSKRPGAAWPRGVYRGEVRLERPGLPARTSTVTIAIR